MPAAIAGLAGMEGEMAQSRRQRERAMRTPAYRRLRRRRALGGTFVAAGIAMALFHALTHLAGLRYLSRPELQDLLLGYPMAAVVAVIGLTIALARG
jgi:hypothetical protein